MSPQIEKDVAVLQRDVQQITDLFNKLDTAISKIGDLATGITTMLAVHEERLAAHASTDQDLYNQVEKRHEEIQRDMRDVRSTLTETASTITREVTDTETRIMNALRELQRTVTEGNTELEESAKEMDARIQKLEKWRIGLVSVGAAGAWILMQLPSIIQFLTK